MRLAIVSVASINEPHRAPYDLLGRTAGWDVHILAPASIGFTGGRKLCDPAPADAGYTLHQLHLSLQKAGRFLWLRGLAKLLRKLDPDAIFVEEDPGSLSMVRAFLARPRAKRIAFTVENIERDRFADAAKALRSLKAKEALRDLAVGVLLQAGQAATTGLACISDEGARVFRQAAWSKPLEVVPLGTDMTRFRPSNQDTLRRELGLDGSFVVGYFGRLVPEKGVSLLVDALPLMPPGTTLLLDMFKNFSPGSYAESLMDLAKSRGVQDRVVTIGVPHADVPRYMSCCQAVVLPSITTDRWKEQFGRVLPEAMACGVPVIGSQSGNIPDMIGDAGILVPENSPDAIAAAVTRLAGDPALWQRLSGAGRERARRLFSVEVQVDRMRALIDAS